MISFILWYLTISVVGWLAVPLAYRLLPMLPGRGFALARPLGLLIWGYVFWLLASLGVIENNSGGLLLALLVLIALSLWSGWKDRFLGLWDWLRAQRRLVLAVELVFLISFGIWAFVRSANPEIAGTEKPMEMAFINAILRSPTFPPHDPWLSGYAISYYYFGYVIAAMLVRLTGIPSSVGFNLMAAMIFGLVAQASYGLLHDMLVLWRRRGGENEGRGRVSLWLPLLAPFFILIVSNLEGFLDVLHSAGAFWTQGANGAWTSSFWSWLNIKELVAPPPTPLSLMPTRPGGVVWWQASRVLQDFTLTGQPLEIIDEFPFFSFLLSDLHPHVLAMPFGLLMIGIALNLFLDHRERSIDIFGLKIRMDAPEFLFTAVALGGMAFMNTWDFPVYLALVCAAYTLRRYQLMGWSQARFWEFIGLLAALGIAGVILYIPFYVGFSSQAGGIIPSLIFNTRGVYFWVMFAPLLIPILAWLAHQWRKEGDRRALFSGCGLAAGVVVLLWGLSFGMAYAITRIPLAGEKFLEVQGATPTMVNELFSEAFYRRLTDPLTWLTAAGVFALAWGLLRGRVFRHRGASDPEDGSASAEQPQIIEHVFPLLLVLLGALLTLGPEFFYLRDSFGTRMNTIFKFYFQTWMVWGLAAAYGTAVLLGSLRRAAAIAFRSGMVVLACMSMAYPVFSLANKTNDFKPYGGFTLDGTAFMSPDELSAIDWLKHAPFGVVAEAVGGDYSGYARVSTLSGDPSVLGWVGHELQWRGGTEEMGSRASDLETLYRSSNWEQTLAILREYDIRYVYVGPLEESAYPVNINKFQRGLVQVYKNNSVTIFEVPGQAEQTSPPAVTGASLESAP